MLQFEPCEDAELMLLATKNDKKAIRHAGKAAWDNKEFVLRMVKDFHPS